MEMENLSDLVDDDMSDSEQKIGIYGLRCKTSNKWYIGESIDDSIKNGYNCKFGGSNGKHSEETKLKMSLASKGKKKSKEHVEAVRIALTGRINGPLSDETKKKLSIAGKGRKKSEEHKAKIKASCLKTKSEINSRLILIREQSTQI